jgi:hypothetical protein
MASDVYSWDQLDSETQYTRPNGPIWQYDLDDSRNDKDVLAWLRAERDYLGNEDELVIRNMRKNLALYKGIQYQDMESRIDARDRGADRSGFMRKMVCNHLYDLTKNRASRLIKFKPAVAVLPANDEFQDKVAAKSCEMLLEHLNYINDFEGRVSLNLATYAMVQGESYLMVLWDKDRGDISPVYKELSKRGRVPMLDENGQQVVDPQGNKIYVDKPVRIGDVVYKVQLASDVLLQRKQAFEDVDYMFTMEPVSTDRLRVLYPDKASEIKDTECQVYDYEKMEMKSTRREAMVYTFWHRRTDMLKSGRKIVFTDTVILENVESPFSHDDLPCERFTDIEWPGELRAKSFFDTVKGLTGAYNNLTNMVMRNIMMVSHPKWMVPAGSVALDRLGNDITIVQYKGPQPPVLAQAQTTPNEVYQFRDKLKEEFQQISGVFGVSRGEPPPGIKAGVALQFLSEQESERYNELVLKWNEFNKKIAKKALAVAGDYYDDDDARMIRVMGKGNAWMTKFFDSAYLKKDYDIRVQNSSALPKSVAARTQTLLDLNERFPTQFSAEQVIDMLDLAQSDKFLDLSAQSVRAAEAENERLMESKDEEEVLKLMPQEFENHLIHWKIHSHQMQSYAFKYTMPPEVQKRFEEHVLTHEYFMEQYAMKNPAFAQELSKLPMYPMFYKQTPPAPAMAPGAATPAAVPSQAGQLLPPQPADLAAFQQPGMTINPLIGGGEQQLPVNEMTRIPSAQVQLGAGGPIEPTNAI